MLNYNNNEIVEALTGAKNINSAIKKFLKNEVRSDPKSERFIKDLKDVVTGSDSSGIGSYLDSKLPAFEPHLLVLARYAYADQVNEISGEVAEKYAEDFNQTYSPKEGGITIKDKEKFKRIVTEAFSMINKGLEKHGISNSAFMKNVLLHQIFDADVLKEVVPLIKN